MGQQQLLLIILGALIVGVAVVVGSTMFQDNALEQNRSKLIADLTTLGSKAQHFYAKPTAWGGGAHSFAAGGDGGHGLTATPGGLSFLASTPFTSSPAHGGQNVNGDYSIAVAGTSTQVILQGVGTTALADGVTYPTYQLTVEPNKLTLNKVN
jgi:hypothetical protein